MRKTFYISFASKHKGPREPIYYVESSEAIVAVVLCHHVPNPFTFLEAIVG